MATPGAESLIVRNGRAAMGADRGNRLTQNEVKKESEQMREEHGDQNPEERPHVPPPSVRKHEPKTQEPDTGEDAKD